MSKSDMPLPAVTPGYYWFKLGPGFKRFLGQHTLIL